MRFLMMVRKMGNDPELEEIRKRKADTLKRELEEEERKKGQPDKPITLTDENFRNQVSLQSKLVIDFWAPWCGPCRMISPIIEDLARKYQGEIVFGKLNIDENPKAAHTFKVMSIPTLIFIKDMELVEKISGALPKRTLEQHIEKHLL
jgi:thioredoxin 1